MQYSPVCDTDPVAYLAYLASASYHGSSAKRSSPVSGRGRVNKSGDRCDDDGSGVVGVFRGLLAEARRGLDEVDRGYSNVDVSDCVRGLLGSPAKRGAITATGLAGRDDGHRDGCVADCVRAGRVGSRVSGPEFVSADTSAKVVSRTELNRLKRERNKARKNRKRYGVKVDDSAVDLSSGENTSVDLPVPEWRRGAAAGSSGSDGEWKGAGSGFWNSCSFDVRQKLIDSKARMHIAENERKAAEARNRVEYLDSPRAIADQVVKLATQLEKQTGLAQSNAIAGWAQTVISSSAESLAKSTPSSVPSFDTYITERSEREARRAEELKQEMDKLASDVEDAQRIAAERTADTEREIQRRLREEMKQQVDSQVHAQIKARIAEFERDFRTKNVVMPKDMRTRAVEDFPLRSHQLAGYVRRQN